MDQVSPAIDHSDIRNVCAPLRFEEKVKAMNRRQTIPKELRYIRNQLDKAFPNCSWRRRES
jgi:hypothetical protein